MIIDKAKREDIKDLGTLYFQLSEKDANSKKSETIIERILQNEFYHLIVVRDQNDRVIGTAMGILCYDLVGDCQQFMVIENVVVLEEYRGKGVGKMILTHLESIAYSNNCSYIILVSSSDRINAHKFYRSLGYTEDKGFKKEIKY